MLDMLDFCWDLQTLGSYLCQNNKQQHFISNCFQVKLATRHSRLGAARTNRVSASECSSVISEICIPLRQIQVTSNIKRIFLVSLVNYLVVYNFNFNF